MDSQTQPSMAEICNNPSMTTSAGPNIFENAFVRTNDMPFAAKIKLPAITRVQMLSDTDDLLSGFVQDYKRMAE